jgi:hypothetical protein
MEADSVGASIDMAVIAELERFGVENSIPPLRWHILEISESLVAEGVPESGPAADTCAQWATALGMSRYEFESTTGLESWYLEVGQWSLEISGRSTHSG